MGASSDPTPAKPANKAERSTAELVEGGDGTKRNAELQSTVRTQSREAVTQAITVIAWPNPELSHGSDDVEPREAAFRETPISVIDQCRNAMAVLLSRWLVAAGHDPSILGADLGKIAEIVGRPPYEKGMVSNLAKVVARLHSRGKSNEAHTKGLRATPSMKTRNWRCVR